MRKVYLLPNFVTTANLFCGFYSVVESIHDDYRGAAMAILAAAVFDALDGRIARLAKATSVFGVEYDSLSDLVSFGLAPSILLYQWALEPFDRLGILACFLFLTCGALRLARFNVSSEILPKGFFQGLPIPMGAGMVATFFLFEAASPLGTYRNLLVLVLTFVVASLMISTIPFPSFKELHWKSKATFGYMMIGVLVMILVAVRPEVTLFLVLSAYIALSLAWNLFCLVRGPMQGKKKVLSPASGSAS